MALAPGRRLASVLWHDRVGFGAEWCELRATDDGFELEGIAIFSNQGMPTVGRYRVGVDAAWRTRTVWAALDEGGPFRERRLEADGSGRWHLDGSPSEVGDGCLDVDLNFSPSTNTLPIRRLALPVGSAATVRALWLRLPDLSLEAVDQRYERLAESRWRYTSGSFAAELDLGPEDLVAAYEGIWRAVAWS